MVISMGNQAAIFAALALAASGCSGYAEATLECPDSIVVHEALAKAAPTGWETRQHPVPKRLDGIAVFDGDPERQFSLAPTSEEESGEGFAAFWSFGEDPAPVWLSCRYVDTALTLVRQLPTGVRECRVHYAAGRVIRSIDCH